MSLQTEIAALTQSEEKLAATLRSFEGAIGGLSSTVRDLDQHLDQHLDSALAGTQLFAGGTVTIEAPPFVLSVDVEAKVESLFATVHDIGQGVEGITRRLDALDDAIDAAQSGFQQALAGLCESLDDRFDIFSAALDAQRDALTEGFETTRNEIEERFEEVVGSVEKFLEEVFLTKPQEAIEDAEALFIDAWEDSTELVDNISQELADSLKDSLDHLAEYTSDGVETAIKAAADRLIELLTDRVATQAAEAVFEVQVGAEVTMLLQPYLPQLMAASAVAPAVQSALDVMRAGI